MGQPPSHVRATVGPRHALAAADPHCVVVGLGYWAHADTGGTRLFGRQPMQQGTPPGYKDNHSSTSTWTKMLQRCKHLCIQIKLRKQA